MAPLDWIIMLSTLLGIVAYGLWKTRSVHSVQSYLMGDRDLKWWTIGLSVMATQASAITFLSTPGQAYEEGMGFAQFYFGLPIAMVVLCIFFLPIFYRLNVYTAYEYLEQRFDLRTRALTAILFLIQRGLAAGLTIYAPAIVLSAILGWHLNMTILWTGAVVIFYTMFGGSKAVSVTQKQQMIVILAGMFIAAIVIVFKLPKEVSFGDALTVAGKMGKLQVVDTRFDLSNRYNIWSGLLGGVFLFMSYFGTDQSQVQRYLSGKSLTESRLGLLFNGILKVPMQFLVLFVGVLVFVFYMYNQPPLHFNQSTVDKLAKTSYYSEYQEIENRYEAGFEKQQQALDDLLLAKKQGNDAALSVATASLQQYKAETNALRSEASGLIKKALPDSISKDTDYVFITFITRHMPIGILGLLLAVIISASMSSTSSELNALATTSIIDIYKRMIAPNRTDDHYLKASKFTTLLWGIIALFFAATASLFDNLIQAVNIIGSLFYGVILGIFMVAFFLKRVGGTSVFIAALIGEALILLIFWVNQQEYTLQIGDKTIVLKIAYLWLNLIGCGLVMLLSLMLEALRKKPAVS